MVGHCMNLFLSLVLSIQATSHEIENRNNPNELLQLAIQSRAKIQQYDIQVKTRSKQIKHSTEEVINLSKQFRVAYSKDKIRIDCQHFNNITGKTTKNYTICKGCTEDGKFYFTEHDRGSINSFDDIKTGPFSGFIIDLRSLGYQFGPIDNLSRTSQFELLMSPVYLEPVLVRSQDPDIFILKRKQKGTEGELFIHINKSLGYSITKIEYNGNDVSNTRYRMTCTYGDSMNGFYFPLRVEQESITKTSSFQETTDVTISSLGKLVSSEAFNVSALDLKYNSLVVKYHGNKGSANFFDGKRLVLSPPDQTEFTSADLGLLPKRNARQFQQILLLVAAMAMLLLAIVLFRRSRNKDQLQ